MFFFWAFFFIIDMFLNFIQSNVEDGELGVFYTIYILHFALEVFPTPKIVNYSIFY